MSLYFFEGKSVSDETKKLYLSTLRTILDNINYYISKKNIYYQEIVEKTKKYIEKIDKLTGEVKLDADKYFIILYKSLTVENYKLAKYFFPHFKLLIINNFLIGSTLLTKFNIDIISFQENEDVLKNWRIIDLIIECLSSIDAVFEDDDIWFSSLDCINEIVKNNNMNYLIKGNTFQKIYEFYFKMAFHFEKEKNKFKVIKEAISYLINNSIEDLNNFYNYSGTNNKAKLLEIYNNLGKNNNNLKDGKCNALELYICRQVKIMVDIICIKENKKEFNNLNLFPKSDDEFKKYKILEQPNIDNENKSKCGYFGWCYICRKASYHYSIDIKVPICTYACKDILFEEEKQLEKSRYNLVKDFPEMLKFLCKILSNKSYSSNQKIFPLEIISHILNFYGNKYYFISHKKAFIKVIKENLFEGLFKTCLSNDPNLFIPSMNLFFIVWKLFREYLKREINFFNINIFLKLLKSTNSSFLQKKSVLLYFSKCEFLYFIELYANYDCELNEKFLVNSIITSFSDIVKGRFSKNKQNYTEKENSELVYLALQILTKLTQSIFEICQKVIPPIDKTSFNKSLNALNLIQTTNKRYISEKNLIHRNKLLNNELKESYTEINNDKIGDNLKKKYEFQKASEKFNYQIKSGIDYLRKIGYINSSSIESEAKSIAKFLRYTSSLKKKNIGEFLGENNELSKKVLKYFGESFDFKNIHIIQALRLFLSTFQLPTEGQKIDRILESFASKYYNDNNTLFSNSDITFYLAYAIMILQTELHNPNVKDKMSLENFMKIFEDKEYENFTKEYLEDIYRQIKEEPLSMSESEDQIEIADKIEEKYDTERKKAVNEYSFYKKPSNSKNSFYLKLKENNYLEYLSRFISSIWEPIITMYSIVIEESDVPALYTSGVTGVSNCIKIFGLLNLNTQKQTIISFLCSMTNLLHIKPIKEKNILCIKEVLLLANNDYRYIKGSFSCLFDIINKLYYYILLGKLSKEEREEYFDKKIEKFKKKGKNNLGLYEEMINLEKERIKKLAEEINLNNIESIFSNSSSFDPETLLEFMTSICEIGKREFKSNSQTRMYLLQKISEVSEKNLSLRNKYIIFNYWTILSEFYIEICTKNNIENSKASLDSLSKLILRYLEKTEDKEYEFCAQLFSPFLEISKKSRDIVVQEYIIKCLINIIKNNEKKNKSRMVIYFIYF